MQAAFAHIDQRLALQQKSAFPQTGGALLDSVRALSAGYADRFRALDRQYPDSARNALIAEIAPFHAMLQNSRQQARDNRKHKAALPHALYADGQPKTYEEVEAAFAQVAYSNENERTYGMVLQFYDMVENIIIALENRDIRNARAQWETVRPFAERMIQITNTVANALNQLEQFDARDTTPRQLRKELETTIRSFFHALDGFRGEFIVLAEHENIGPQKRKSYPIKPSSKDPRAVWGPNRKALVKAYEILTEETGQRTIVALNNAITHMVLIAHRMPEIHGTGRICPERGGPTVKPLTERHLPGNASLGVSPID